MKKNEGNCSALGLIIGIAAALVAAAAAVAVFVVYREQIEAFCKKVCGSCAHTADTISGKVNCAKEKVFVKCESAKDKFRGSKAYTDDELSDFADV